MTQSIPEGFHIVEQPLAIPEGFRVVEPEKPRSEQNFFERFGEDLKHRFGEQGAEIINAQVAEDQDFASTALQLTGKVGAGAIMDFMWEAMVSGGRGLSAITPDFIEDPLKENATKAGIFLLETDLGQKGLEAAKNGVAAWQEFSEENPVAARNIESIVNIGLLVTPIKGKPKAKSGSAGNRLIASGERAAVRNQDDFVKELVTPRQIFKERVAQVKRITEQGINRKKVASLTPLQRIKTTLQGINKKKVISLSPSQQRSADAIRRIATVSPKKTLQGNYQALADASLRSTRALERSLRGKNYDWTIFGRQLQDTVGQNIKKSLVGDEREAANLLLQRALELTANKPKTLNNILKARRELDNWVLRHKKNAFDSPNATAMTNAVREVRSQMNNFINARVPGGRVKRSLEFQSSVLRAMDDVAEKAALEWDSRLKRAFQNAVKVIPIRNEMVAAFSLITGMGGLGAAAMAMPFVQKALIGYGLFWAGKKAVISPATRKGLGQLVNILEKGIRNATDPLVIMQLRADRVAVIEMIKSVEVDKETN